MSAVDQGPFLETSFLLGPDRGQGASLSGSAAASPQKPASRTERAWPDATPARYGLGISRVMRDTSSVAPLFQKLLTRCPEPQASL